MTLTNLSKAPFPWFGGKRRAAPVVWDLLGDVEHYVEPFAGSLAVLLERPHPANRTYYSETVNDLDGFIVNFWRAIAWSPEATADAASWPITEADKQARQIALLRWRSEGGTDRLAGDATYHDPVMAGWWAYAVSAQIGAFHGRGPWIADPTTGKLTKQGRAQACEPGVRRDLPHLSGNGQGVAHAGTREPGVSRNLPHLSGNGQGVARPQTREPGVTRDRPHLIGDGQGVARPGTREPGVLMPPTDLHGRSALDATDWGATYHDQTMPELIRWFRHLAARLRHVRILNGEWSRLVTNGASLTIPVRMNGGHVGVFLDPPYSDVRADGLYGTDSLTVADDVRAWCVKHGSDPRRRIVLAGYDTEHGELEAHGWTVHEWFTDGYLTGGMGNIDGTSQQRRERLWASPACLTADPGPQIEQLGMFG